jgi:hypothetical protein
LPTSVSNDRWNEHRELSARFNALALDTLALWQTQAGDPGATDDLKEKDSIREANEKLKQKRLDAGLELRRLSNSIEDLEPALAQALGLQHERAVHELDSKSGRQAHEHLLAQARHARQAWHQLDRQKLQRKVQLDAIVFGRTSAFKLNTARIRAEIFILRNPETRMSTLDSRIAWDALQLGLDHAAPSFEQIDALLQFLDVFQAATTGKGAAIDTVLQSLAACHTDATMRFILDALIAGVDLKSGDCPSVAGACLQAAMECARQMLDLVQANPAGAACYRDLMIASRRLSLDNRLYKDEEQRAALLSHLDGLPQAELMALKAFAKASATLADQRAAAGLETAADLGLAQKVLDLCESASPR